MRQKLWSFDTVTLDFEDQDATVLAVHGLTGAEIRIRFRLTKKQVQGRADKLRQRLEVLAADKIMDLSSFLEHPD